MPGPSPSPSTGPSSTGDRAPGLRGALHPRDGAAGRGSVVLGALAASTASGQLMDAGGAAVRRPRRWSRATARPQRPVTSAPLASSYRVTARPLPRECSRPRRGSTTRRRSPRAASATPCPAQTRQHSCTRHRPGQRHRDRRPGRGHDRTRPREPRRTTTRRRSPRAGVGQTMPGADEASWRHGASSSSRFPRPTTRRRSPRVASRTPAVAVDSGTSFDLPSVDSGTASNDRWGRQARAAVILAQPFAARRQASHTGLNRERGGGGPHRRGGPPSLPAGPGSWPREAVRNGVSPHGDTAPGSILRRRRERGGPARPVRPAPGRESSREDESLVELHAGWCRCADVGRVRPPVRAVVRHRAPPPPPGLTGRTIARTFVTNSSRSASQTRSSTRRGSSVPPSSRW